MAPYSLILESIDGNVKFLKTITDCKIKIFRYDIYLFADKIQPARIKIDLRISKNYFFLKFENKS